jgi:hypothetical protein
MTENGASLATPLVAGATACILQAHPSWGVDRLRTNYFLTASYYLANGAPDPLYIEGFGIIDAGAAFEGDCNRNGSEDSGDLASGVSGDCNGNAIPDECDVAALTSADEDADGLPDECTECQTGPGCPEEVEMLMATAQHPDVVLSWNAAPGAADYSIRRDETAQEAGTTEVARVPGGQLSWTDTNAMVSPPDLAFYIVRGLTSGGIAGP